MLKNLCVATLMHSAATELQMSEMIEENDLRPMSKTSYTL